MTTLDQNKKNPTETSKNQLSSGLLRMMPLTRCCLQIVSHNCTKEQQWQKQQPTSVLPRLGDRIEDYKLILQLVQETSPVRMAVYTKDYSWSAHTINQTISTLQKLIPAFYVEMLLSYNLIEILVAFLRSTSSLYTAILGESVKIWVWTQCLTAVFCYLSTFRHENHCTTQTVVEGKLLCQKMSQLEMSKCNSLSEICYS